MGKKSIYLTEKQLNYIKNTLSGDKMIKLFHNTSLSGAAGIINDGVIRCNMCHSEGHGDMVWFTTKYDDYGSECKLSIEVPKSEIDNGTFEFVNRIHVVTYQDVDISKYNLQVEYIGPLSFDNAYMKGVLVGFDKGRLFRLIDNAPNDKLEESIFNGFYVQYGNDENIKVILDYLKSTNTALNESKKGKKIYLTENQMEEIKQRLQQARQDTNTNATQKQKEAGNYKHGRVRIQGFDISIENPCGSYRSGTDKKGKEWKILMKNDYGYFTHTLGKDGDAVDVFIGNNLESKTIFCIDQRLNGKFDETKVMLGFNGSDEAKKAYLSNFEDNWKGFWKITAISIDDFKKWLYNGYRQRKPFFEYVDVKKKKLNESKHLLNESVDNYFADYDVYSVINQYISDVKNGIPTQKWTPLINPAMYQKALQHFTKWGNLNDYPVKYIYQWMGIIIRNTVQLNSNTELAGHSYYIDYEGIENSNMTEFLYNKFGIKVINWNSDCHVEVTPQYLIQKLESKVHLDAEEQQVVDSILQKYQLDENIPYHKSGKNKNQTVMFMTQNEVDDYDRKQRYSDLSKLVEIYNNNMCGEQECRVGITSDGEKARIDNNGNIILTIWCLELLDMSGIYDWMQLPDGSDAWSDFGLKPLFDLISEFDEDNSTPEQTLVIINKCLDITHQRGDLSSMFIEGGTRTLSQISNGAYINENRFDCTSKDWEMECLYKYAKNGVVKLYHNTKEENLANILYDGKLDTHKKHREGHGDMLWFTVKPDDFGLECKISIEVPIEDFINRKFRFVNNIHVITKENILTSEYNFKIETVDRFTTYDEIMSALTGDDIKRKEYFLFNFFQETCDRYPILQWFVKKIGVEDESYLC